jgi:DNA-binding MarR family transcriptional regulator
MIASLAKTNSPLSQRPILWNEDIIAAESLSEYFRIGLEVRQAEPGHHILALEDELLIRQLARKLQEVEGTKVDIYQLTQSLGSLVAWVGINAVPMITMGALPYETWLKSRKNQPLELESAVAIAEDIIKCDPDSPERNIALDLLGRRAGVSEYNWDKKYLASLRARFESALALPDVPESLDPTERKRLELKALSQERDPDKFTDGIVTFCRRYGWSRRDVEARIRQLKTSTTTPKAKRLKGKDFLALETESISWVFPGIIPSRGVVVLGGHAGTGKTTLAYDAVGSVLLREEFLGEKPVTTGKVLVVTGDELPCFTQDKLIDRGIPLDNEDWDIILNWDVSQWDVLEEALADVRPSLVIIDSFSSIHRDPSFDENSSQAKSTIYDLEALTNAYGCGCILIHHLSKSKENQGVAKLRGSSAISAAASVVCLMEQTSDGTRKLSFPKVRGAQTEPFLVNLDGSTGRYQVVRGGDDATTKSLGNRILAFLQKEPYKRFEQDEISAALGIPSSHKDSVYQALGRLFKRGLITKRPSQLGGKRKVYGVTNPSQLSQAEGLRSVTDTSQDPHPPMPAKVSVQNPETVTTQELEVTDTLTDNLTDSKLTPPDDVQPDSASNQELESVAAKLTDTDSQGCVCPPSVETVTYDTADLALAPLGEEPLQQTGLPIYQRSDGGFEVESKSWLDGENLQAMAELLAECEDAEQYDLLQQCWNLQGITEACITAACKFGVANNLISYQKYDQLTQWEPNLIEPNHG